MSEYKLVPVQRWTGEVKASDLGGFVAYGDYLELQRKYKDVLAAAPSQEVEPVYTVPIEVEGHDVLYRLQDHPEPRSDCGILYKLSPTAEQAAADMKP